MKTILAYSPFSFVISVLCLINRASILISQNCSNTMGRRYCHHKVWSLFSHSCHMHHTSLRLQRSGKSRNKKLYYVMSPRIPLSLVTPGKLRKPSIIFPLSHGTCGALGLPYSSCLQLCRNKCFVDLPIHSYPEHMQTEKSPGSTRGC